MWFISVEVEQEGVHPLLRKNPGSAPVWGDTYLYSLYKGVLPWASGSSLYVRSRSCICNMPPRALTAAYYASSSSTIYQSLDEVRLDLPCTKTYFALLATTFHCVIFNLSGLFFS